MNEMRYEAAFKNKKKAMKKTHVNKNFEFVNENECCLFLFPTQAIHGLQKKKIIKKKLQTF